MSSFFLWQVLHRLTSSTVGGMEIDDPPRYGEVDDRGGLLSAFEPRHCRGRARIQVRIHPVSKIGWTETSCCTYVYVNISHSDPRGGPPKQ